MRLEVVADNLIEELALHAGIVPTPLGSTIAAMLLARTIMIATKLGIFEVLAKKACTAKDVALLCGLDHHATQVLLIALTGIGYVKNNGSEYMLAPVARKWLLRGSPQSLYDYMLFNYLNWTWSEHFEEYIRTGKPVQVHQQMSDDEWGMYQRAMRSLAGFSAYEVARRTPLPRNAMKMLDIGGSHGYYSVMLCRLHPGLQAVVLDLPEAIAHSKDILAQEGMGERIVHRVGNALEDDLGYEEHDLIFIGNLLHHFDAHENQDLIKRCARALRPHGYLVIEEFQGPQSSKDVGALSALSNLYFSATSTASLWSLQEIAAWEREAGLTLRRPIRLFSAPGVWLQAASKK